MANAAELSFRTAGGCDLAIVAPNDPAAMQQYAEECRVLGIRYIYDPSQQVARVDGPALRDGFVGASILICNDYEFELFRQKTGMGEDDVLQEVTSLIITRGEKGSSVLGKGGRRADVAAV